MHGGKTPVHKVNVNCHVPVLDSNLWNENRRHHPHIEPLLKAYETKDLDKVKNLLASSFSVNYREIERANRTPLIYAVKYNFDEAVDELLNAGADPNLADDSNASPLHIAAKYGSLYSLRRLLQFGVNANVKDASGKTPLHFATRALGEDEEENAFNIVKALLIAGAAVSVKDNEDRTPLHDASFVGNTEVLSLLLSGKGASLISGRDKNGRTPLHESVLGARSIAAVKKLLQYNPPIDAKDNVGQAPIHYVAGRSINYVDKEFDGDCLELLLHYGASVQNKDNDGYNALSLALQRTMWWNRQSPKDAVLHSVQLLVSRGSSIIDGFDMWRIVETFPSLVMVALNQSIRTTTSAKDSPHLKLILNFRPLTVSTRLLSQRKRQTFNPISPADEPPFPEPLLNDTEISMLHYIFLAGHKNILRHPLCSAFLHLKWLKVRRFFFLNVMVYFMFVLTFTKFILLKNEYNENQMQINNNTNDSVNLVNDTDIYNTKTKAYMEYSFWVTLLSIFCILFSIKEILQILHNPLIYIRHYENYVDIFMLICVMFLLINPDNERSDWQKNLKAVAIILSWSRLMLFFGQFPSCGVYIVMFSTVCKTVFQFLAMYIPLLIGFALGFKILLNELPTFEELHTSFITTLVMMSGEIDYKAKFFKKDDLLSSESSQLFPGLILIIFLFLIYIILSNLLVALAVNDLNAIQQRSELLRLSRQVELMVTVESFMKSPFVPKIMRQCLQKQFSICQGHSEGSLVIHPNKKPGYIERLFVKLLFVFRCRKLLTKVFEHFVVNFIPPDAEPTLPKRLVQEAIQLALTELEIEKRDKLLSSKSHQISTLRHKGLNKKQGKNTESNPCLHDLPKREDLQNIFKNSHSCVEDYELDQYLGGSCHQVGIMHHTPSIKASLWRASIRKEAHLNLKSNLAINERQPLNEEVEQLQKQMMSIQDSLDVLNSKLTVLKPDGFAKRNSYPGFKRKNPISSLVHSFPYTTQSIAELSSVEPKSHTSASSEDLPVLTSSEADYEDQEYEDEEDKDKELASSQL